MKMPIKSDLFSLHRTPAAQQKPTDSKTMTYSVAAVISAFVMSSPLKQQPKWFDPRFRTPTTAHRNRNRRWLASPLAKILSLFLLSSMNDPRSMKPSPASLRITNLSSCRGSFFLPVKKWVLLTSQAGDVLSRTSKAQKMALLRSWRFPSQSSVRFLPPRLSTRSL